MQHRYDEIWERAQRKIAHSGIQVDTFLNDILADGRRGLTLIARLPPRVVEATQVFLGEIGQAFPGQYYYPQSDLHLTVLTLVGCSAEFPWQLSDWPAYWRGVEEALENARSIPMNWMGITASSGALLLQGFPNDNALLNIREAVRQRLSQGEVPHSIDTRYVLDTAHSTIMRFQQPVQRLAEWRDFVEAHRRKEFGSGVISELEFVWNDWYMRQEKVKVLRRLELGT